MTTPTAIEKLVEIVKRQLVQFYEGANDIEVRIILGVVFSAIEAGEVCEVCPECNGAGELIELLSNDGGFGGGVISNTCKCCHETGLVLKPGLKEGV